MINNGNKKERSSIRSEIKRVINKKKQNKTKRQLTRRNARQQRVQETRLVYLHKHDVTTVPLPCPITSITRTLSISAQIGLVITNHVRESCYSFDKFLNNLYVSDELTHCEHWLACPLNHLLEHSNFWKDYLSANGQ